MTYTQSHKFKGYRGSSSVKGANAPVQWDAHKIAEIKKCKEDPFYFIRNYMKIVSIDRGVVLFDLYDYQEELIQTALDNRFTVAEMARQSGKTTAITGLVLWFILFNENKTAAILANKQETAVEVLSRIQDAYELLPDWLQQGVVEWNKKSFVLENGCRVMAAATSKDNIRGYVISMLIIDEAAHIENWEDFFTSVMPTISSSKQSKMILISTVNGLNHFYEITEGARKEINNFKVVSVDWRRVPGRDDKWREETLATMNHNIDKFEQEFENRYLGSSGTLIAGWKLQELASQPSVMPVRFTDNVMQYEKPKKNHNYFITVDVSRGKGLDYSIAQVIDVTKMPYEQVMIFRDNQIAPADFAEHLNYIGRLYNEAPILIEINDLGEQTSEVLFDEYEYPNILFTESAGRAGKRITQGFKSRASTDRGIRTTKTTKKSGCSLLKLVLEQGKLILHDKTTIGELCTFSKKNESYEAEEGKKDDLAMGLVLFAWSTDQTYFKHYTGTNPLMQMRDSEDGEDIMDSIMPFGMSQTNNPEDAENKIVRDGAVWTIDNRFQDPWFPK